MKRPKHLYYITHRDNLKSILKNGILSHSCINKKWWTLKKLILKKITIYDAGLVKKRKEKKINNHSLWEYANVYFQARNPMLYRVVKEFGAENIVVLELNSDIINTPSAVITNGNAVSASTQIFEDIEQGLNSLSPEQFEKEYWNEADGSKRKIMAEVLIYNHIPKEKIIGVYTANAEVADQIRKDIIGALNIMLNPKMFFLPDYTKVIFPYEVSNNTAIHEVSNNTAIRSQESQSIITLKEGDMFFSKMHTFTISVNTVGIMGKGLASRSKNQFPDVYKEYQDICRQKKLKMGIPYLYKREMDFIKELMEDVPSSTVTENGQRWFLLFPTKNHWREKSPIDGIEKGLQWLLDNYKSQGITSLALPALGCGLGGLNWKHIGPLMCKYLSKMEIQSCIYLPLETQIPEEQKNPEFLFNNS